MAAQSNRSPSPVASRPINPNFRNSDNNPAIRRSFSGKPSALTNPRRFEPITPANSPSDFGRRHSVDSYPKEKENCEKDHNSKPSKFHPSAKGSKNFMAPTISASSKFTPSPKKKVLVERNDPVRTSISLSDGKAMFYSTLSPSVSEDLDSKTEIGYHKDLRTQSSLDLNDTDLEQKHEAVQEGTRASKPSKKVSFLNVPLDSETDTLSESVITESENSKVESSLKNELSCSSDSSCIAPLDADPLLPPYDPKTNYLSPRPQFLHYRPNPRVKILLNKEKGLDNDELKQLEDSLLAEILSESFSDSEDPQKEDSDVVVSDDMVVGIEDDNPHASEPESLPVDTTFPNAKSEEKEKEEKPPRSVSKLVCFSVVMMFIIACGSVYVFNSPALSEIAFNELRFSDVSKLYHQSRIAESAKTNFDRLARNVNQLSVNYVSFMSNLVIDIGKRENIGSLQYMNLSSMPNDGWNRGEFIMNKEVGEEIVEDLEKNVLMDSDEKEFNEETEKIVFEEYVIMEKNVDSDEKEFNKETEDVLEEYVVMEKNVDFDEKEFNEETEEVLEEYDDDEELEKVVDAEMGLLQEFDSDDNLHKEFGTVDDDVCLDCVEFESEDSETIDAETDELGVISHENQESELSSSTKKIPSDSSLPTDLPESEGKFCLQYVTGLSTLAAFLIAVAGYTYTYRHKRNPGMENAVQETLVKASKKTDDITTYPKNWQQREVDESCPSEMSSFGNTAASYSGRDTRGISEVQSRDRKSKKYYNSKRESLATSSEYTSTSSPSSYGSFTTFERIPIKIGNGEEEVITPVRRSNRIRNNHSQATSP